MRTNLLPSVANHAVFQRIWACFFVVLRACLMACGLLVCGLVLIEICLYFGLVFMQISVLWIAFFQILWHFFCFNLLLKKIWACFCENVLILGLYFQVCLPVFLLNFPTDFLFCWIFLANACWACFWLNYLCGLVFQIDLLIFVKQPVITAAAIARLCSIRASTNFVSMKLVSFSLCGVIFLSLLFKLSRLGLEV